MQGIYANARSHVCVGEGYSEEFEVKVGVHHGLVLSSLLFVIVLEALHASSALGSPGWTSMPMTWNWSYLDDLEWAWTSCRVQVSFHVPSVALEWAATASSATAANTGCTRNAVGSSA